MDTAKEIRILLAQENLKASDLARLLNTSHQNLNNILRRNNPSIKVIEDMASALGYDTTITFTRKDHTKRD